MRQSFGLRHAARPNEREVFMENNEKGFELSLTTLWTVLQRSFIFILVAAILAGGLGLFISLTSYEPVYTAKTDVFIINEEYQGLGQQASNDINTYNLALTVIKDCKKILEGKETKRAIAKHLGVAQSEMSDVVIAVAENYEERSRILNISVTAPDPELSYRVAEAMIEVAQTKINEFCSHDVKVVNSADLPSSPSNKRVSPWVYAVAFAAAVFVYVVSLLHHIFDDRIRTIEDVERLSLSLLAEIPNTDEPRSDKKYGYYGRRYGGYYSRRYGQYGTEPEAGGGEENNENG